MRKETKVAFGAVAAGAGVYVFNRLVSSYRRHMKEVTGDPIRAAIIRGMSPDNDRVVVAPKSYGTNETRPDEDVLFIGGVPDTYRLPEALIGVQTRRYPAVL
ncbi:MAG TPA: hypothetical protein VJI12_03280 [archaeon]|nr:hypothetical protein [archaeon]